MICKAANTWLDSAKELYVDVLSRVKSQEASKFEESHLGLGGEAKGTFAMSLMQFSLEDPLDSVRELFSGFKDSMKAELSSLNSRIWHLPLRLKWTLYLLLLSLRKMRLTGRMMKFLWHLVVRRGCFSMKRNLTTLLTLRQ
jgi:hypothetical protein